MNPERSKSFRLDKYQVTHPVLIEHEGMRLDAFVSLYMPTLSREFVKSKIIKGEVVISGRRPPHKASVKVHQGESVLIVTHNNHLLDDEMWYGKPIELDQWPSTVYEDGNLLICNKPPFMITHPAGKHLFYCATVYYETQFNKTMHSIHRLDRETSGLLILGKNPEAAQTVGQLFEDDKVRKCYFLITVKAPNASPLPFTAHERLGQEEAPPRGMMYCYPPDSHLGKDAETTFELVWENETYALLLAFPVTGRQHQIRAHAFHYGYPLLGDKIYNGDPGIFMRFKDNLATQEDHEKMQIPRQALHALAIWMTYPNKNKIQRYTVELPLDLTDWMKKNISLSLENLYETINKRLDQY